MQFRNIYTEPVYEDAPYLSDQLLLPNIIIGGDLYIITSFLPSYIISLVNDLAATPEVEPGSLTLNMYVAGGVETRLSNISRLRAYLEKEFEDSNGFLSFLDDVLQLEEEGGLNLQVLFGPGNAKVGRGCKGAISSPSDESDYVTFLDALGGDYNSPVHPMRSWIPEEADEATDALAEMIKLSRGDVTRTRVVPHDEVLTWLLVIQNQVADEIQGVETNLDISDDGSLFGYDDELEDPLEGLPDFANYFVGVDRKEIVQGHIAPVSPALAEFLGPAKSICPCGIVTSRRDGCPDFAE